MSSPIESEGQWVNLWFRVVWNDVNRVLQEVKRNVRRGSDGHEIVGRQYGKLCERDIGVKRGKQGLDIVFAEEAYH